ncbi:phosphatase PAP2 family protein [Altererythrobacter arenosus]|uniref:Phosphatase PAP2 family protein n=1 Tax=Altererythrobacter arenosus TaxID=3032592 RepID=A0ABY8FPR6_9SPHN|nr:phosphatase PAP2 family protein [Altererythrobacter sp. CAU 1644]WFL76100.1 phosphatase PAP2 family protein [Altererythrobacter sp. CAU 1644]
MSDFRGKAASLYPYSVPIILTGLISAIASILPTNTNEYDFPPFIVFAFYTFVLIVICRPLWLVFSRHPEPTKQILTDIKDRWPWLIACLVSGFSLAQTVDMVMRIKVIIPELVPFYADPVFLKMDRILFFGQDAWRISHAIIGTGLTRLLDQIYVGWHFFQVALYVFATVNTNRMLQLRVVITVQLCWIFLGGAMALLASSVGPCFYKEFYGAETFTPLLTTLEEKGADWAILGFSYLLDPDSGIGAGISAMPSMHVSIATIFALVLRDWKPSYQVFAWLYALIIFLGSFHLGWHYAVDGIVAALATGAIWVATGKLVDHVGRHPERATNGQNRN